ncbi:probable E3 ubiquitin-protein ligase ZFP1 [Vicia villosa]|uniref:probable E3 ubiquitin-protein ligase ZFP1 n=1 Tax=Vicia villosa TaxID=3911 RepID=UPI00273B1D22|nr:probable E3 ubiquitin-protein ligase ZFP1 [Vicia villosa]
MAPRDIRIMDDGNGPHKRIRTNHYSSISPYNRKRIVKAEYILRAAGLQKLRPNSCRVMHAEKDEDEITYEELFDLAEQIGNACTGLSMKTIETQLKTKVYTTNPVAIALEKSQSDDQKIDSCIICHDKFTNQEEIAILQCEHEFHIDCITKCLILRNKCPNCKSEALTSQDKDA